VLSVFAAPLSCRVRHVRYGLTGLSFGIEVTTHHAGEGVVPCPAVAPPPVLRDLTDSLSGIELGAELGESFWGEPWAVAKGLPLVVQEY